MSPTNLPVRRLSVAFNLAAIVLGALQTWNVRHDFDSDGISYLDLGDAYMRGDWTAAINAYWSPLYSYLLGLATRIIKPTPYWEFTVVHLLNFTIYLSTIVCFNLFLRELIRYNRHVLSESSGNEDSALPVLAWLGLGYSLFISSALVMINIKSVSPDMAVAGVVYLASSILLRIYMGSTRWLIFLLLGIVLGVGYLTKAAMFPLAFIFLGVSIFAVGSLRDAIPRVLVAVVVFLMIAFPFIAALSHIKGRLTVSDTPKLSYAWLVNGVPAHIHWQGETPGNGKPLHPTRKIFDRPAVYEFATPIRATYPPWYDPSYWHEGIVVRFDLKQQLWRLAANSMTYLEIFFHSPTILIVGFLSLCIVANRSLISGKSIAENWILMVPAIASLAMYSLVLVETRYVGPFLVLLCSGIACGVRVTGSQESKKLLAQASIALLALIIVSIGTSLIQPLTRELIRKDTQSHLQWQVAEDLKNIGIRPGDRVAFIGDSYYAYWARLARVRIVAEIPHRNIDEFSSADHAVTSQVFNALAKAGAKVVLTNEPVVYAATSGWQKIGNTDHYVHMLNSLEKESAPPT